MGPINRGCWSGRWEGGRIWRAADGGQTYHLQRMVGGRRYSFAVGTSRRAAIKQLERFEAEPARFAPGGTPGPAPIYLDNALALEFLRWSGEEKGNTAQWVGKQKAVLAWWMERLRGVDLRRASLRDHVLPALERAPARRLRAVVLKALYSWLRKRRHLLTSADDCTLDLSVPPPPPAQWARSKVVPPEHLAAVLERLGAEERDARLLASGEPAERPVGPWRDALLVQAGTGWHTTELVRFAGGGSVEPLPRGVAQEGVAAVLVCPLHKSGAPIRTRVTATVAEAARRLRAHGPFSREWYDRAVRDACAERRGPGGEVERAGIPVFTPGRLRHSVATWAVEAGADPAAVAAFLGHRSARTTVRFYATMASVARVPTLA